MRHPRRETAPRQRVYSNIRLNFSDICDADGDCLGLLTSNPAKKVDCSASSSLISEIFPPRIILASTFRVQMYLAAYAKMWFILLIPAHAYTVHRFTWNFSQISAIVSRPFCRSRVRRLGMR